MNNKLLLFSNLIFLSAALFFGYEYFKRIKTTPDIKPVPNCSTCGDDQGAKFGGIKATTARNMSANYKTKQLININSAGYVNNDARSVWFPLDTLKRFLYEIESKACASGCNDKAFGVRVYYAAYPVLSQMTANSDLMNLDARYEKLHTIFMIPTYTDPASGGPVDFDPWHMNGCRPKTFQQIMNGSDSVERSLILAPRYYPPTYQMRIANTTSGTNTVRNHGGLCPPDCVPLTGISF